MIRPILIIAGGTAAAIALVAAAWYWAGRQHIDDETEDE